MTWKQWETTVVRATERYLSWRKGRKAAKRERQRKKNPIADWLDAIVSAVVIVLLINQYLLQAYQIPSQSMVPTLLISDRIFVNKVVYGPELVPGMLKLPGFRKPERGDVIIFESPEYIPIGPLKDILQRVIYMVTLSLVDIDRDENGQPKHHFLIKRAIGMPGDRLRMREGNVEILTPGESVWKPESALMAELGVRHSVIRRLNPDEYPGFKGAGIEIERERAGLPADPQGKTDIDHMRELSLYDEIYVNLWRYATLWELDPSNAMARSNWTVLQNGWKIKEDSVFPMGDNRDDSRDARYFGQVRLEKVLGKALLRYWPLGRIGLAR